MPEYYLGIDVGVAASGDATTGLCLISLNQNRLTWECRNSTTDDGERLEDLRSLIPCDAILNGVGIDGPLIRGLRLVNYYRAAESLLAGGPGNIFRDRCLPARTDDLRRGRPLHCHATRLARMVLQPGIAGYLELVDADHVDPFHQSRIVEAFPNAFLAFLLADEDFQNLPDGKPRGEKSDQYWEVAVTNGYLQALINHLAPGVVYNLLRSIRNHDRRAAFICAVSAMCVARNEYIAVGEPMLADIILPPLAVWGRNSNNQPGRWPYPPLTNRVASVRRNPDNYPNHENARVICNGRQWMP